MMDGDWFGLAASAAGGGLFGVIGTTLGRVAGYFEQRQQNAFEQTRWAHDVSVMKLRMEAEQGAADAARALEAVRGSWQGLQASHAAEAALGDSYPFVNAVRALTRPALTLLLWLITALVFFNVEPALRVRVMETAVFAATAATLWWFGDRTGPAALNRSGPRVDA
jgi:hypothetical protein